MYSGLIFNDKTMEIKIRIFLYAASFVLKVQILKNQIEYLVEQILWLPWNGEGKQNSHND